MAVARGDAVYNSPIFETGVKGGAYSVTLHLYRRAIAGAIHVHVARGLSLHKRSRLHFLRGSKEEAARVAEEAKSHFETGRCFEEMDSQLVTRAGNMDTTNNSEASGASQNNTMSKKVLVVIGDMN